VNDLFSSCLDEIRVRRQRAEDEAERRLADLVASYPEFAALEREMNGTAAKVVAVFRDGTDVSSRLESLKEKNMAVQEKRREFLRSLGKSPDYLLPHYVCPICSDTGFVGSKRCVCLQNLISAAACRQLNASSPLSLSSFDGFSLSYYEGETREHMARVLRFVREYAETFTLESGNLLFYGGTGLGKTHLSLAVANEVIRRGYDVVYGQAQTLFSRIADERFSRESVGSPTEESLLSCDLLVLDDLGAEFVTQMSQSVLYNILNTRLLAGRPILVSTNIPLDGLDGVYHERITSRLSFEFEAVPFVGKDVRQLRKHRGESK